MIKYQAESSEYFVVEIYYDDSLIKNKIRRIIVFHIWSMMLNNWLCNQLQKLFLYDIAEMINRFDGGSLSSGFKLVNCLIEILGEKQVCVLNVYF